MLPVTSAKATIMAIGYASDDGMTSQGFLGVHAVDLPGVSLDPGMFYRNVPVTLVRKEKDLCGGNIEAKDGDVITSYGRETNNTITIAPGATVTLCYVNINTIGSAGITCLDNATIIFEGTNIIENSSSSNHPAVQAGPDGTTLTILGNGSLTATACTQAAGIGSGFCGSCGDITITGGTITATGGSLAAGIGSGLGGSCGVITITGGTVTAYGGENAAGIGCGLDGICDNITITNGVTRVTAIKGTDAPYSVGKGSGGSNCGTITIGGTDYGDKGIETSPFTYP